MAYWRPGEGVCHHIVLARDVPHIGRVLGHVGQLPALPGSPRVGDAGQSKREGLVVRQDVEGPALQQVTEVAYSLEAC